MLGKIIIFFDIYLGNMKDVESAPIPRDGPGIQQNTPCFDHNFCSCGPVFSKRELCYRPSVCLSSVVCLSVVCLSVTLVHPTQAVEIFRNISMDLVPWPSIDIHIKFYGGRPKGTPLLGELNARGVAKYSDFGLSEGYISETVQDRR